MILAKCILLLALISMTWADCHYWDGTAPFCDGSCPGNCVLEAISDRGNGAVCWTGQKELCNCCPTPQHVCTPTETDLTCYGYFFGYGIAICQNKEVTIDITGHTVENTCSVYICGACFGFGTTKFPFISKRNDDGDGTSCRRDTVFHLSPMREDVYIRGRDNMTQNDIQRMLVKRFGKKQNKHNMTIVMINEIDPSSRGLCNK